MESASFFTSAREVSTCHFHRPFPLSLPRCYFAFIFFISFRQLRQSTAEKCVVILDQVVRFIAVDLEGCGSHWDRLASVHLYFIRRTISLIVALLLEEKSHYLEHVHSHKQLLFATFVNWKTSAYRLGFRKNWRAC